MDWRKWLIAFLRVLAGLSVMATVWVAYTWLRAGGGAEPTIELLGIAGSLLLALASWIGANKLEQRIITVQRAHVGHADTVIINEAPSSTRTKQDRANRDALLSRMERDWIDGVFKKSLYREALIDLGKKLDPDAVAHDYP